MSAEKLISAYTKIYAKSETEIKEKLFTTDAEGKLELNDDSVTVLLSWDEAKVKAAKDKETTAFNNGHKKAQGEALTNLEKTYREAGLLSDSETSADVIAKFEALKSAGVKASLTDDDIKKHPLFLSYEAKVKTEYLPKAEHDAKIKEFADQLAAIDNGKKFATVDEKALSLFNTADYIMSDDPARKQNQVKVFLKELKNRFDDVEITADGTVILIKDGKRLEDAYGNLIIFDSIVADVAGSLYDKKAQGAAGSAGNKNDPPKTVAAKIVFKATTIAELTAERSKLQALATTPEEKIAISKAALEYEKIIKGK